MSFKNHPNFFLIGFPKCGTSALASFLNNHPQVYFSPVKEPSYYSYLNQGGFVNRGVFQRVNDHQYKQLFKHVNLSRHLIIGEGSVSYCFCPEAIQQILLRVPKAKFVIMIRNPMSAALSLYAQKYKSISKSYSDLTHSFDHVWANLESSRDKALNFQYDKCFQYSNLLPNLLDIIPKENLHFVVFDDFCKSNDIEFSKVCVFLGIRKDIVIDFNRENDSYCLKRNSITRLMAKIKSLKHYSQSSLPCLGTFFLSSYYQKFQKKILKKLMRHDDNLLTEVTYVSDGVKKEMCDFFNDDIIYVERLMGRSFSHWREQFLGG